MLRIVGILAIVAVLASAVFASAAWLNVEGGYIQAGQDLSLTCAGDVKVTNWGLERHPSGVLFIKLSGLSECEGGTLFVDLLGANGTPLQSLSQLSIAPETGTGLVKLSVSPAVDPAEIYGIKAWVHSN